MGIIKIRIKDMKYIQYQKDYSARPIKSVLKVTDRCKSVIGYHNFLHWAGQLEKKLFKISKCTKIK